MERYKRITTTAAEGSKSDLMVERSSSGGETGFKEPTCQGLYPQRPHEPDCMFYRRTGSCKFGVTCRFNHPPDISSRYPERPKAPDCAHYLMTGSCKFGVSCKFNHPQPVSVQMPTLVPVPVPILPLPQGMVAGLSLSSCQAPPQVSAATSHCKESTVGAGPIYGKIKLFPSAPRSTGTGVYLPSSVSAFSSSNNQNKHTFVERPKFGSYHHPPEWSTPKTDSVLDPLALPGRSVKRILARVMSVMGCITLGIHRANIPLLP